MEQRITDQAIQYLRYLEAADYSSMRALCTDKATVWHNDGKSEQSIDENLEQLKQLMSDKIRSWRYDIIRQFQNTNEVLQQQLLHLSFTDGSGGEVLAAMYFRFENGLIDRIEEYANFVPLNNAPATDKG